MADRRETQAAKRAEALKAGIGGGPLSFVCPRCGGDFKTGNTYIPHAEDCPKYQREREQEDKERAALSRSAAPFQIDSTHEWDCPCDGCENDRRKALTRILRRAGQRSDGLAPKPLTGEDL